jgi:hypothetical protein
LDVIMASLPIEVLDRTGQYLDTVDEALPGLVTALCVVGSTALGAWQPGHSDIDTVIVTSPPLTPDDLAALEKIRTAMPQAPKFDGIYLDQTLFEQRSVVPWWPSPDVKLFNVMVHSLNDTTRHAGQADILREQLDGRTGTTAAYEQPIDVADREAYRWKIGQAAKAADPARARSLQ